MKEGEPYSLNIFLFWSTLFSLYCTEPYASHLMKFVYLVLKEQLTIVRTLSDLEDNVVFFNIHVSDGAQVGVGDGPAVPPE